MIDTTQLGSLPVDAKRELLRNLLALRDAGTTGRYPLSPGQQALWFVYQMAPESPAYNFLFAARLPRDTDLDALARAFDALIQRHPAIRSRFVLHENKPVQVIDAPISLEIPRIDVADWTWDELREHLEGRGDAPFDLARGPSLRVEFYERADEVVLLLVFHHLVADLWSMDLLIEELQLLYAAEFEGTPANLAVVNPAALADFLRWQLTSLHGPRGQAAWDYWQKELGGELPVLQMPIDRPRPARQSYAGANFTWPLSTGTIGRLRQIVGKLGTTLVPAILSAFQVLLARCTGQPETLIGVTTADRGRPEWERLVGYFLNQVVLRSHPDQEGSFLDLLQATRDRLYQALEYQDFPFPELVRRLAPQRDPSRSPIFTYARPRWYRQPAFFASLSTQTFSALIASEGWSIL